MGPFQAPRVSMRGLEFPFCLPVCRMSRGASVPEHCFPQGQIHMAELVVASRTDTAGAQARESTIGRALNQYFYFLMSLMMVAIVVYGFSYTIDRNLIHPAIPRPLLLYVHASIFTIWLGFFVLQSLLVSTRNVRVHRTIGWAGMVLGGAMPLLGVWTAIVMTRFDTVQLHQTEAEAGLLIPLWDMMVFASSFGLAMYWRTKPEFHRRLVLIATCALTAAAFGRFPARILPPVLFYGGVDLLIFLGVVRDLIVNRSVHRVYRYALPMIIVGQILVMYVVVRNPPVWQKIAHTLAG
jgi:hypothetical protein